MLAFPLGEGQQPWDLEYLTVNSNFR